MLTIAEQLLLITLDDANGEPAPLPMGVLDASLAGALLMDLVFAAKLKLSSKSLYLDLASPLEDSLLREIYAVLKEDGLNPYPVEGALRKLASPHWEWSTKIADCLVKKHILEAHEETHLWIFKTKVYPMVEGKEEHICRQRVRNLLLQETPVTEAQDLILLSLLARSGLLDQILSQEELTKARPKIEAILKQNHSFDEVIQAIITDLQAFFARLVLP